MTPTDKPLAEQAKILTESVRRLNESVVDLSGRTRRNRQAIRWAIAGLVGDLVLSGLAGWLFVRAAEQREQINDNVAAIAVESERRERQSCEDANIATTQIRVGIADVLTGSLVRAGEAQGRPADPAVIEAYRADLEAGLEAALPYRDCSAEAEARANDAPFTTEPLE